MKIISFSENKNIEKRIAITPEIAKKYIALGFKVSISKDYGSHLGFDDDDYKISGVEIVNDKNSIITDTDIIAQIDLPSDEILSSLKEGQTLVGVLNPFKNKSFPNVS